LLSQGTSRATIVLGFEQSPEFRGDVTQELYQRFLHRAADPTSLATVANS